MNQRCTKTAVKPFPWVTLAQQSKQEDVRKRARGRGVRKSTDKGHKRENRRGMENGEDEKNERDDGEETGW